MSETLSILVVDDEAGIRELQRDFFLRLGHRVHAYADPLRALEAAGELQPDLAIVDIRMPKMDGLELLERLQEESPCTAVVMLTGHATMEAAIQALRLGASDFLRKPVHLADLEVCIERCGRISRYRRERLRHAHGLHDALGPGSETGPIFVCESPALAHACERLRLAAESRVDNLVLDGETGSGKEVLAAYYHRQRRGADAPFLAVNCPALPETLIESELFGHERGAFTGAGADRPGAFELAQAGTLFLDEVGDLSPGAQAKLLRAIETRVVRRVGGSRERTIDVTVIAASNRPLAERVRAGRFREDLFYRLNTLEIRVPPLRERPEDILPLANHFLEACARRLGRTVPALTAEAHALLREQDYRGNVRELRNVVERACVLAGGAGTLGPEHLSFSRLSSPGEGQTSSPQADHPGLNRVAAEAQDEAESTAQALARCGWNRRKAADLLKITYEALRWRIRKYRLREEN